MARFNDHGENLRNFIFVVTVQITQKIWIELKQLNLMTANHSRNQSEHVELNLVFIVGFLQFAEKFLDECLWVINGVNWEEISGEMDE